MEHYETELCLVREDCIYKQELDDLKADLSSIRSTLINKDDELQTLKQLVGNVKKILDSKPPRGAKLRKALNDMFDAIKEE